MHPARSAGSQTRPDHARAREDRDGPGHGPEPATGHHPGGVTVPVPPERVPSREEWERIVDLARRAPSVHNTQPWSWQVEGDTLSLWADRSRALPVADPDGRNLLISCGAALHHALVAAEALGWHWRVDHLPDPTRADHLARIALRPAPTPSADAGQRIQAIEQRHTDRRRFTSWPMPEDRLEHLTAVADHWGTQVRSLDEPSLRTSVERLLEQARAAQVDDELLDTETRAWIDRSTTDGVPAEVLPVLNGLRGERAHRFGDGPFPDLTEHGLHPTEGLLVICTETDGPYAWLHTGATLSDLWLRATTQGMSVVPLSQVIEVARTRHALRQYLARRAEWPQLLLRVGWQSIGRSELPRTPRRPLRDVLR